MAVRAKTKPKARKKTSKKSSVDFHLEQAAKHLAEAKKIDFNLDAQFRDVDEAIEKLRNTGQGRSSSR